MLSKRVMGYSKETYCAGGPSGSPVFKSQPVTPPSTDTAYLGPFETESEFDSQLKDNSTFGALLIPPRSLFFAFPS